MAVGSTKVVVIGNGYMGSMVAQGLAKKKGFHVTTIDQKPFLFHKIAGLRAAVKPEWQRATMIPRDNLLGKQVIPEHGDIVTGEVKEIIEENKKVIMEDGKEIIYDYLVMATGARNLCPGDLPGFVKTESDLKEYMDNIADQIKKAKKIGIVGAGVVGIELAGEIRSEYKDKEITLIHSNKFVLNSTDVLSDADRNKMAKKLEKKNINLVLGSRLKIPAELKESPDGMLEGNRTLETENDDHIDVDLTILCIGIEPRTKICPRSWLDDKNFIDVNENLSVKGTENIFAVGDCINVKEKNAKTFITGQNHPPVIISNIINMTKNKKDGKLAKYKLNGAPPIIAIPLGANDGIFKTPFGYTAGGLVTSKIKSEKLFTPKLFSEFGSKAPIIKA
eukprot:Pgem_evm1s19048